MTSTDIFAISPDVVSREVAGETVMLDLESGQYFGLDGVGRRIWELLTENPRSADALADILAEEYDAPRETIKTDALALIEDLHARNLVVAKAA